jgi:serine/threonine protein kinase
MIKTIVDDYRIIEHIGQGVFSIVYKAEHIKFKSIVALK